MTNSFEDLMKMVNIAQSLAAIAARILSERKTLSTSRSRSIVLLYIYSVVYMNLGLQQNAYIL